VVRHELVGHNPKHSRDLAGKLLAMSFKQNHVHQEFMYAN
jgi:hypothetical protein